MDKDHSVTHESALSTSKHVRAELQRKRVGFEYQIKVVSESGADLRRVKALFVNTANWHIFKTQRPKNPLKSVKIDNIHKESQWWLKHPRKKDLCSPTSLSMVTHYFTHALRKRLLPTETFKKHTISLAENAHDPSLDIYGNWLFNVAEAFDATRGNSLYRVERLNNFEELHSYLLKKIPIAVSVRGWLYGCAWAYKNGHFVVVIGWEQKRKRVICLDPAFGQGQHIVRHYPINDFVRAWGKSRNLSYVPIPKKSLLNAKNS